jgi:anti-sigma B factor antagonist
MAALSSPLTVVVDALSETTLVRLIGDPGSGGGRRLQRRLAQVAAQRPPLVVLDLARLEFLNSLTISVLLEFRRAVLEGGGLLWVAVPPGPVADALAVAGLDEVLELYDSVSEALG